MKQVIQMDISPVPPSCSVGRAPAGSATEECEALLEQYDAVIVSNEAMITYVDRIPKLTGGVIPSSMTDQFGAELRDLPVGEPRTADENEWRAT
jgi:hypothetical protein